MPKYISSSISGVLAALAVSDLDASVNWLSRIIGRHEDARPMDGLADWYLGAAGTIQLTVDPERAGGSMITLVVDDIADTRDRLSEHGIQLEVDSEASDKVKFAVLLDPDGNNVTIVEPKSGFDPQGADE
jgi:catechol 2,3-dioxygenase-like lactoylglutathione lyase family enzyme